MKSYSQNFEDIILWRAFGDIQDGFYIDIGAQHPEIDSVSKIFYDKGWSGINVEPSDECVKLLRKYRTRDLTIQAAVGVNNSQITFYEIMESGLSTTNKYVADNHKEKGYEVIERITDCIVMDDVLSLAEGRDIHWLKIDVEGAEKESLEGWVSSEIRPWVLIIESTYPNTQVQTHERWEKTVLCKGYKFVYFDGLNRFYVSIAHHELIDCFSTGPNVFDAINYGFKISENSLFFPK